MRTSGPGVYFRFFQNAQNQVQPIFYWIRELQFESPKQNDNTFVVPVHERAERRVIMAAFFAYAVAWLSTAAAAAYAVKVTGSAWCLWALLFPACIKISETERKKEDEPAKEEDENEMER